MKQPAFKQFFQRFVLGKEELSEFCSAPLRVGDTVHGVEITYMPVLTHSDVLR